MKYYRYEDRRTTGGIHVYQLEFDLVKETPQGAWIESFGWKKFVKKNPRKKFACSSKEAALESFRARKNRQIKILTKQLENAYRALELAKEYD